jgi:hypothetical protein
MRPEFSDPERLLKDPRVRKWMKQCTGCRRWGYRHDAPARFFSRSVLEKYFEPLKLDELGRCEQCQTASSKDESLSQA